MNQCPTAGALYAALRRSGNQVGARGVGNYLRANPARRPRFQIYFEELAAISFDIAPGGNAVQVLSLVILSGADSADGREGQGRSHLQGRSIPIDIKTRHQRHGRTGQWTGVGVPFQGRSLPINQNQDQRHGQTGLQGEQSHFSGRSLPHRSNQRSTPWMDGWGGRAGVPL